MISGTLYGVGVGPGDPDLMTVKAARIIAQTPVIAVPVARLDGESYALSIAADRITPQQQIIHLHFPMLRDEAQRIIKRREAAEVVVDVLRDGQDVAFLTEGDPLLHSTFGYLLQYLPDDLSVEIVPGVTSILAAAADTQQLLVKGDERLAILPATFENIRELPPLFAAFDTVVLMKIHTVLHDLLVLLDELNLTGQAIIVERASHPQRRVFRDVNTCRNQKLHYLSLMIVYSRKRNHAC